MALAAVGLIFGNLRTCYSDGANLAARRWRSRRPTPLASRAPTSATFAIATPVRRPLPRPRPGQRHRAAARAANIRARRSPGLANWRCGARPRLAARTRRNWRRSSSTRCARSIATWASAAPGGAARADIAPPGRRLPKAHRLSGAALHDPGGLRGLIRRLLPPAGRNRQAWQTRDASASRRPASRQRAIRLSDSSTQSNDDMKTVVTVSLGSSNGTSVRDRLSSASTSRSTLGATTTPARPGNCCAASRPPTRWGSAGRRPLQVGLSTVVNKDAAPAQRRDPRAGDDPATLRQLLQVRAVRTCRRLGHYNNNVVLFMSGMRNYELAVALSDYTRNLNFADALFPDRRAGDADLDRTARLFAKGNKWVPAEQAARDPRSRRSAG